MVKVFVCKTVVAYPGPVTYVCVSDAAPHEHNHFNSLHELAAAMWRAAEPSLPPKEPRFIKNEVPIGDLYWVPTLRPDRSVTMYERLTKQELLDLARELRKGREQKEAA